MNPSEHELARKLVRYLDEGLDRIEPRVRERLAAARMDALAHYRAQPTLGLAGSTSVVAWITGHARLTLAAAALVIATAGVVYWQNSRQSSNGLAELDAYLLTDELPINAYLDKGFDSWLKRSSR
jgi:hypothetical protein